MCIFGKVKYSSIRCQLVERSIGETSLRRYQTKTCLGCGQSKEVQISLERLPYNHDLTASGCEGNNIVSLQEMAVEEFELAVEKALR